MKSNTRIIFMGTPEFSVPSLKEIFSKFEIVSVYTQPPKNSGRGLKKRISPIQNFAEKNNLIVRTPINFADSETINEITKQEPDFIVVVAYGIILPLSVLNCPKYLCLNGHASDLPRWRGAAPIQRAIEAGDKATAVSAMIMEETLDTGPVIIKKIINIQEDEPSNSLHDKMSEEMPNILLNAINLVISNQHNPINQSKNGVTYAKKISSSETIIDWTMPGIQLKRKLQALSKWPGCWTHHKNNRIRIHDANVFHFDHNLKENTPGQIVGFSPLGYPIILCGKSSFLEIIEIQREGKSKMNSNDFLRGYNLEIGEFFEKK
jgi:methionyl-tRNA formyltransferase